MRPSVLDARDVRPFPDEQCTDALGSIPLVRRHRQQVHRERTDMDREDAYRLRGVGVHQNPALSRDATDLRHGFQRADFIVGVDHRDQHGVGADGRAHIVWVHPAIPVDREIRHIKPARLKKPDGFQHGVVLDRGGDDMPASGLVRPRRAEDGEVVGLRGAAGEHDLLRGRPDGRRNHLARLVNRRPPLLPELMHAAGVAELFSEERQHRLHHSRIGGGGGAVIDINALRSGHEVTRES